MPERRWRVLGRGRGLFAIEVTTAVPRGDNGPRWTRRLRQRELFGAAADYSVRHVGSDDSRRP